MTIAMPKGCHLKTNQSTNVTSVRLGMSTPKPIHIGQRLSASKEAYVCSDSVGSAALNTRVHYENDEAKRELD